MKQPIAESKLSAQKTVKAFVAALSIILSLGLFFIILNSPLSAIAKFMLGALCLAGCGTAVAWSFGMESWAGLIMLKGKYGLSAIDSIAKKRPELWQWIAEVGMVVAYGSFAYFLMGKKNIIKNWKSVIPIYVIGTFLLVLVSALIPVAMSTLLSMVVGGNEFATAGSKLSTSISQFDIARHVSFLFLALGGVTLVTTSGIVVYAGVVGMAVLGALTGNAEHLANTSPGGMPILPGINLDLIQGVIGLAIILVVHESMHGILSRVHKLPLKSAGLVFFGFLPFGAFVDIDEKKLFAAPREKQNAVLVAGTAANFATGLFFLALLIAFFFVISSTFPSPPDWARYVSRLLALVFSLNMVIAAINLVPLPLFDGYHLMKNAVGNKTTASLITWLVAAAFILTMFPWLLR